MAGLFGYDNNPDYVVQEGGMSIWFAEAICPIRSASTICCKHSSADFDTDITKYSTIVCHNWKYAYML